MQKIGTGMDRLEVKVDKIFEDMYYGNGNENPSVTMRLDRIERVLSEFRQWKWIIIAATVAMIADIISNHFRF